jgi:hypothetical protein
LPDGCAGGVYLDLVCAVFPRQHLTGKQARNSLFLAALPRREPGGRVAVAAGMFPAVQAGVKPVALRSRAAGPIPPLEVHRVYLQGLDRNTTPLGSFTRSIWSFLA